MAKGSSGIPQKHETSAGIREGLKKATTEMLVLFLLRQQSMYTYEMMQEIAKLSQGVLTFNTMYLAIYRAEKSGYIVESGKVLSNDNRTRVYFTITEMGQQHLAELVQEYHRVIHSIDDILRQDGSLFQEDSYNGAKK